MKKLIHKHIVHPIGQIKSQARKHLVKPHEYCCEKWVWYKWWHKMDYHRHIHYLAMFAGILLAVYFVMIDSIMMEVTYMQ